MDCLVQDFPFSTVHLFDDSLNNVSKQNATNQEDSVTFDKSFINNEYEKEGDEVVKQRSVRVDVAFDGLTYKMRVRKEESIVKIIDFSF